MSQLRFLLRTAPEPGGQRFARCLTVFSGRIQAAASHGQVTAMAELRMREKVLGTTVDARRDLRIRYVDLEPEAPVISVVSKIDDRRQKLMDA